MFAVNASTVLKRLARARVVVLVILVQLVHLTWTTHSFGVQIAGGNENKTGDV